LPEPVRDLGDLIDLINQRLELVLGGVAGHLYLKADLIRDRGFSYEVPAHLHSNAAQFDAGCARIAEEVIGDASGDHNIEQLSTVEATPSTPAFDGPIHYRRERPSTAKRRDLAVDVLGFHLDMHAYSSLLPKQHALSGY
jgi:hypothetical protein